MRYSVSDIRYEPMEEDNAFVDFYFSVVFIEPEPLVAKTIFPFRNLLHYIQKEHADFYAYINEVRDGLDDWRPAEAETIEALGEEGITLLYTYLEEYLLACNWMESFYNRQLELSKQSITRQTDNAEKAKDMLEKWQDAANFAFDEQKRYRQFCKLVQKEAHRIAIEIYPELLDANKEQMKTFKYVFVDGIIKMHNNLSKHLEDIE